MVIQNTTIEGKWKQTNAPAFISNRIWQLPEFIECYTAKRLSHCLKLNGMHRKAIKKNLSSLSYKVHCFNLRSIVAIANVNGFVCVRVYMCVCICVNVRRKKKWLTWNWVQVKAKGEKFIMIYRRHINFQ